LSRAKDLLKSGQSVEAVKQYVRAEFARHPSFLLEYFEVVDTHSMQPMESIRSEGQAALCLAAYLGGVRLIDNVVF